MVDIEQLHRRAAEREQLLGRILAQVTADPRIVAAWLFGSLGRETADDLSDIDLWLVVADDAIEGIAARRWDYVAQVTVPLMVYDGVQNAPVGGAYLMALYDGLFGPHQVDWYWQPHSLARRPAHMVLLFDRVGIPAAAPLPGPLEPREPQTEEERTAAVNQEVSFFWVMANIAAKTIARRHTWGAIGPLRLLEGILQRVRWLTGVRDDHPGFGPEPDAPPPLQPLEQLAFLRCLTREMEDLAPQIERVGATCPQAAISQIYRFFDLCQEIVTPG